MKAEIIQTIGYKEKQKEYQCKLQTEGIAALHDFFNQ